MPPNTPHRVLGKDGRACRFLVVQGGGAHDFIPSTADPPGPLPGALPWATMAARSAKFAEILHGTAHLPPLRQSPLPIHPEARRQAEAPGPASRALAGEPRRQGKPSSAAACTWPGGAGISGDSKTRPRTRARRGWPRPTAFPWLGHLKALGSGPARDFARHLARDWIAAHDRWTPLAWRPDVLARRLINWFTHFAFIADGEDEILASASAQAATWPAP